MHSKLNQKLASASDKKNKPVIYPEMPVGFQISNENLNSVFVTAHAWGRFCERWFWGVENPKSNDIVKSLQRSFTRAKPVCLEKAYATLRLINNNFIEATYFFDQGFNCRFVVILKDDQFILTTVEHPYSK